MERAHQVLSRGGIDTGLASHGRIHHRQQRGGGLDDRDSPHPGRGRESGEIGHGPTTQTHHGVAAAKAGPPQAVPQRGQDVELLGGFGIRHLHQVGLCARAR